MAVPVRSQSYHDPMAGLRRRRALVKRAAIILASIAILAILIWLSYWSSVFAITEIRVEAGKTSVNSDCIASSVNELLDQKRFIIFRPRRNLAMLDVDAIATGLLGEYPSISDIRIDKEYPHTLIVSVSERHPAGQWCRQDSCQLFDREGVRWGITLPSSGPLLLLVQDERGVDGLESSMLQGMLAAVDGLPKLGIAARKVILPDAEPGGIRIESSTGYQLYFDALGDVVDQLSVLTVFLADKAKDPAFSPQYIDLRTPGRVYYK